MNDTVVQCTGAVCDPFQIANFDGSFLKIQLWALVHGLVTLQLAHLLPADRALPCLAAGARNLMSAFGDDPRAVGSSIARAADRSERPVVPT